MKKSNQFFLAIKSYGKAFDLIANKGMAWTFLVVLLIDIAILALGMIFTESISDMLMKKITAWISFESSGSTFVKSYLPGIVNGILWITVKIAFFFAFGFVSGFILQIVMSPILAYVSEKTEAILAGRKYQTTFKEFLKDILRGLGISFRNLFIELLFIAGCLIIGFIPVIGWMTSIFLFFVSCYFYGFSFMDFTNERQRRGIRASVRYVRKNKWLAIGNGFVFALSLFIPFCNKFIPAFVAIISTSAATIAMLEIEKEENNSQATPVAEFN